MIKGKTVITLLIILISVVFLNSCFYHKADVQYPSHANCDTSNITFSNEIKSILDANCKSCHDGTASLSGIDLYDYNTISSLALDGQFTYGTLLSAIMHKGGAPEMPQGEPMLDDCTISKIAAWVHANAPDN